MDYPAAVFQMVSSARRRLSGAEALGADAWNSPMAGRPEHFTGVEPFSELWDSTGDSRGPTRNEVADAIFSVVDPAEIEGLAYLAIDAGRLTWTPSTRPITAATGQSVDLPILVTNDGTEPVALAIDHELAVIPPGTRALMEVCIAPVVVDVTIVVDGEPQRSPALIHRGEGGSLQLRSEAEVRWSVRDVDGHAYFPEGVVRKWDSRGWGYFHSRQARIEVLPGRYTIVAARGIEYWPSAGLIEVSAGGQRTFEVDLRRRIDPQAAGWHSADLHVHANYGGEVAIDPDTAMMMQRAEGLDFMNLVAANNLTDHVHDVDLFRAMLDRPLPHAGDARTHIGIEYRNDLYGHFHATGARVDPGRYQTGHTDSTLHDDWPINSEAARRYQEAGAVTGYCHPVLPSGTSQASALMSRVLHSEHPRTPEARFAIVDAALGFLDSLDVLSNADNPASGELYRRMVGAGLPVAVSAGSDAMLSVRRCGKLSNPPGWVRMYARTGSGIDLTSLQRAIRDGRTMATNGPWLEVAVDGCLPGDLLDLQQPGACTVTVRVVTDRACTVRLFRGSEVAWQWQLVAGEASTGWSGAVSLELHRSAPIMAEVHGDADDLCLGQPAYAHTSPVRIHIGGRSIAHVADVQWCIEWLDQLKALISHHGRGVAEHLDEIDAVIDTAATRLRHLAKP